MKFSEFLKKVFSGLVVLCIAFIGFFLDFGFNINSLWKLVTRKRYKEGKRQEPSLPPLRGDHR